MNCDMGEISQNAGKFIILALKKEHNFNCLMSESFNESSKIWQLENSYEYSVSSSSVMAKYRILVYKHQRNTRWGFARKLEIFTRENNVIFTCEKITVAMAT